MFSHFRVTKSPRFIDCKTVLYFKRDDGSIKKREFKDFQRLTKISFFRISFSNWAWNRPAQDTVDFSHFNKSTFFGKPAAGNWPAASANYASTNNGRFSFGSARANQKLNWTKIRRAEMTITRDKYREFLGNIFIESVGEEEKNWGNYLSLDHLRIGTFFNNQF